MQKKKTIAGNPKNCLLYTSVISNSVSSAFENAFHIPALYTTIVLVILAAVIVLRKNATVKVLDILVPIMATCYFAITLFIIFKNVTLLPSVFARIFEEAFGIRQAVAGGFGAILMNGVKSCLLYTSDKARRQKLLWKKWIQYLLTGALLAVGYEIRATVILTVCSIVMYTVLQIGGVKEEISYFGTVSTDSDGSTASERGKHFRRAVQQSVISVVCFVAGLLLVFAAYEMCIRDSPNSRP